MDNSYLQNILKQVAEGSQTPEEAMKKLKTLPYEDLGFVNIDKHRALRTGNPEVIFCQGKTPEQIALIIENMERTTKNILATRATLEIFNAVKEKIPKIEYNQLANIMFLKRENTMMGKGKIAVVSAGTADIPVAEEAAFTGEFYGSIVDRIYDVGVAGIHRLFSKMDQIREAKVIIVVAGMEGALASVVGGLVEKPVIAVPTSIGYGTNLGGLTPLFSMLNSCALGVSVMNIDNGFGAGYFGALIDQL